MICCLASAACPLRDMAAPLGACSGKEVLHAVYDAGIDLGHYGEVDQPLNLVLTADKSVRELVIRDGRPNGPEAAL